jgi:hypothetical protein
LEGEAPLVSDPSQDPDRILKEGMGMDRTDDPFPEILKTSEKIQEFSPFGKELEVEGVPGEIATGKILFQGCRFNAGDPSGSEVKVLPGVTDVEPPLRSPDRQILVSFPEMDSVSLSKEISELLEIPAVEEIQILSHLYSKKKIPYDPPHKPQGIAKLLSDSIEL